MLETRGASAPLPLGVDWLRPCRSCRPGKRGALLVKLGQRCRDCAGIGRVRITLPDVSEASADGVPSVVGLARRQYGVQDSPRSESIQDIMHVLLHS